MTVRHYSWSLVLSMLLMSMAALSATAQDKKPNILVIWGDDIGRSNISAYTMGLMGYRTPNIDRVAKEGMIFTDYYGEQSCTAGRSSFIMGQSVYRTGLSKVGLPGADLGMQEEDPSIAGLLKAQGYVTGQFGKNHLGDKDKHLPIDPDGNLMLKLAVICLRGGYRIHLYKFRFDAIFIPHAPATSI